MLMRIKDSVAQQLKQIEGDSYSAKINNLMKHSIPKVNVIIEKLDLLISKQDVLPISMVQGIAYMIKDIGRLSKIKENEAFSMACDELIVSYDDTEKATEVIEMATDLRKENKVYHYSKELPQGIRLKK